MTRSSERDLLLVLGSRQRVMRLDKEARQRGLSVDTVVPPRSVSSDCGVALEASSPDATALVRALAALELEPDRTYRRGAGGWEVTTLERVATEARARPAPATSGEDQETPDVAVAPGLVLVHSADLLPLLTDDPFSFGSVAAVHALSPVYARGGAPLSGLHLICAPRDHDEGTLAEILRGGTAILERAAATPAGPRRVDAPELLYGLAVTGTAPTGRTWRATGARPGDLLVLTKPLGGGVLLATSRHHPVDPTHLRTALRWMTTLDERAAQLLREASAHAVTPVGAQGLVGHLAGLAAGSGLRATLELAGVPLLPGVGDAAAATQGDRRDRSTPPSRHPSVELGDGCDPALVDLVTLPQVSGGLLAAVAPEAVDALLLGLTGAAVVGRFRPGSTGQGVGIRGS